MGQNKSMDRNANLFHDAIDTVLGSNTQNVHNSMIYICMYMPFSVCTLYCCVRTVLKVKEKESDSKKV